MTVHLRRACLLLLAGFALACCDTSAEVPVMRDVVVTIDAPALQRITLGTSIFLNARVETAAGVPVSGYSASWIGDATEQPLPTITVASLHAGLERVVLAPRVASTYRVKLEVITPCPDILCPVFRSNVVAVEVWGGDAVAVTALESSARIAVGEVRPLQGVARAEAAGRFSDRSHESVTYATVDATIAAVDAFGNVRGVAVGATRLVMTAGDAPPTEVAITVTDDALGAPTEGSVLLAAGGVGPPDRIDDRLALTNDAWPIALQDAPNIRQAIVRTWTGTGFGVEVVGEPWAAAEQVRVFVAGDDVPWVVFISRADTEVLMVAERTAPGTWRLHPMVDIPEPASVSVIARASGVSVAFFEDAPVAPSGQTGCGRTLRLATITAAATTFETIARPASASVECGPADVSLLPPDDGTPWPRALTVTDAGMQLWSRAASASGWSAAALPTLGDLWGVSGIARPTRDGQGEVGLLLWPTEAYRLANPWTLATAHYCTLTDCVDGRPLDDLIGWGGTLWALQTATGLRGGDKMAHTWRRPDGRTVVDFPAFRLMPADTSAYDLSAANADWPVQGHAAMGAGLHFVYRSDAGLSYANVTLPRVPLATAAEVDGKKIDLGTDWLAAPTLVLASGARLMWPNAERWWTLGRQAGPDAPIVIDTGLNFGVELVEVGDAVLAITYDPQGILPGAMVSASHDDGATFTPLAQVSAYAERMVGTGPGPAGSGLAWILGRAPGETAKTLVRFDPTAKTGTPVAVTPSWLDVDDGMLADAGGILLIDQTRLSTAYFGADGKLVDETPPNDDALRGYDVLVKSVGRDDDGTLWVVAWNGDGVVVARTQDRFETVEVRPVPGISRNPIDRIVANRLYPIVPRLLVSSGTLTVGGSAISGRLAVATSRDGGLTWDPTVIVRPQGGAHQDLLGLTRDSDGALLVTMSDDSALGGTGLFDSVLVRMGGQ